MKKKSNNQSIIIIGLLLVLVTSFVYSMVSKKQNKINVNSMVYSESFVNILSGNKSSNIAFASLMKNPTDLPLWLKYHRNLGIKRFFIRLEDSLSWEDYLKDMDDVVLEIGNSDTEGNNYSSLIDRQIKFVNETLEKAKSMKDIEWLIHIDADELLHGDIGVIESLPENIKTIKMENAEAIFEESKRGSCFSSTNFIKCNEVSQCKSYINGKAGGRIHDPRVICLGPHDFGYKDATEDVNKKIPFDKLHILHFEGCTFGGWVEKFYHLSKNNKTDLPFAYYKESIEKAKDTYDFYKINKMQDSSQFRGEELYKINDEVIKA